MRVYQTVENSLVDQTDWADHALIGVIIHERYGFNERYVGGVIEIGVPDREDNDTDPFEFDTSFVMDAETARRLAAQLTAAADAADVARDRFNADQEHV